MPNYITNRLEIIGDKDRVREVMDFMKRGQSKFDFNNIMPEPEDLYERPDIGPDPAWYMWRMEHWGVKWNAPDTCIGQDGAIWFHTAWDGVADTIIRALSERFPDVRLEYAWADEDVAYNCGEAVFVDGERVMTHVPDGGTKEALDIYTWLHPGSEGLYAFRDGEVKYIGNENE